LKLVCTRSILLLRARARARSHVGEAQCVWIKFNLPHTRERLASALRASQALQRKDAIEVREDIQS